MPLDFNTPVCQHHKHVGHAVPATIRLEHQANGVKYLCNDHPSTVHRYTQLLNWVATYINQHAQPAQERG